MIGIRAQCVRQRGAINPLFCVPRSKVAIRQGFVPKALFGKTTAAASSKIYDISVKDIDNKDLSFKKFAGSVVLVCNVASQCGFTPQYNELSALYDKYRSKGLVVLGAPCNQFGAQEPGSNSEIKKFAANKGAKFPMLAKLEVNGGGADPLFKYLKKEQGGMLTSDVKWNFTKFLVDREGKVVGRYPPTTTPAQIEAEIVKLL